MGTPSVFRPERYGGLAAGKLNHAEKRDRGD